MIEIKEYEDKANSIHSMLTTKECVESFAKISSYSDDGYV